MFKHTHETVDGNGKVVKVSIAYTSEEVLVVKEVDGNVETTLTLTRVQEKVLYELMSFAHTTWMLGQE